MRRFWQSRAFRKFRRSRMAMAASLVILAYGVVAVGVMFFDLISLDETTERVGPQNLPGFGLSQMAEKRYEDAEFEVNLFMRALKRNNVEEALAEIRLGERRAADRSVAEVRATVAQANAMLDELGAAEDINAEPELLPKIDALEALTASLWAPLSGWAGFWHGFKLCFGTDRQGRSIAARGLYAVKVAVQIGIVTGIFAVLFGSFLGAAAAFFGGWVDHFVIWLYSSLSAIPTLVLLGVLVFMFSGTESEQTLLPVYTAFCLTFWIGPCRVVRGEVLRLKELDYVQAATSLGQSRILILLKHIIPNVSHLVFVNFSLLFIGAIKSEVILTFLGLGVKNQPSWGIMINQSKQEVVNDFFWQIGAATALMFLLVLAFNIFTDALQDALDPKHIA